MKYLEVKDKLLVLFKNAKSTLSNKVHIVDKSTYVIYRGFKISLYNDGYIEVLNVRSSDFYKFISDIQLVYFIENGFEKTCDVQQIIRDKRRIILLTKRIRKAIEDDNSKKWVELRRDRRSKTMRIVMLKRKDYATYP